MGEDIKRVKILPKTWKCFNCGAKNKMDIWAGPIFEEHGLVLRNCDKCCAVNGWEAEREDIDE